jgi:phosphatidylglycerophosphate synthase
MLNRHDDPTKVRDSLLKPISKLLSGLHVTPDMVSLGGVGFMVLFVISFQENNVLGIIFFALSIIADWIDGPLARYEQTVSVRGRLVDIISDAASFCCFLAGMMLWKFLSAWTGAVLMASVLASTVAGTGAAMRHAKSSGMQFQEMRGFWFFPGAAKVLLYGLFLITAYRFGSLIDAAAILASIALIVSSFKS